MTHRFIIGALALTASFGLCQAAIAQPDAAARTPEQVTAAAHQSIERSLRLMMQISGLDENAQNTIVNFLNAQAMTRQAAHLEQDKLRQSLRNTVLSDAEILQALTDYRLAITQEKEHYTAALKQLDNPSCYRSR